jgi:SAM-dependent methyltransferase
MQMQTDERTEIEAIRKLYLQMEPPGCDTWSPLRREVELQHRIRLMQEACHALRMIPTPAEQLRVLDVGCGVGRSTRLFVDLGITPANIIGIDFRESALEFARRVNPAIRYRAIAELADWPSEQVDMCIQCTVFSSIKDNTFRQETAKRMDQSVGESGFIFWWDIVHANTFAGGDALDPRSYFPNRPALYWREVSLEPEVDEAIRPLRGMRRLFCLPLRPFGFEITHRCALLGPKR